jgi:hypothetical protein
VQENTFKSMQPFQKINQNLIYTEHVWLEDENMVGGTSEGEVFVLHHFEKEQAIENGFQSDEIMAVSCIRTYSKGFFVASDTGYIALWVR